MSSNFKSGRFPLRIVNYRGVFCCGGGKSSLEQDIREGENPVFDHQFNGYMIRFLRVELFGNAAQNGW
jgi:hypothetical protein